MSRITDILSRVINLEALIRTNPGMFDIAGLDIREKMYLLQEKPKIFSTLVLPTITSPYEKSMVLINVSHRAIRDSIELTDEDLEKLDNDLYFFLLESQFKKYIRLDLFARLPAKRKSALTLTHPKWVLENVVPPPRLTNKVLLGLSKSNPELVDTYVKDFSDYATTAGFWKNMIKFDAKYRLIFLKNTKSLITKTDVRSIIKTYPSLVKDLNEEIIANSKLTVKEWVLLCDSISEHKDLAGWEFSDEMKEIFKLDSLADLLSGKAKLSKRFSNAMAGVLSTEEEEEDPATEADKEAIET